MNPLRNYATQQLLKPPAGRRGRWRGYAAAALAVAGLAVAAIPAAAQTAPPPSAPPTTAVPAPPPAAPGEPAPPAGPPLVVPIPGGTVTVAPGQEQPEAPPPEPEAAGDGTASLLRGPDLRGTNQPTLYEKYGTAGYSLDKDLGWRDMGDEIGNTAASFLWGLTTVLADAAAKILQWSYSLDLFGMTSGAITDVTAALSRVLYTPFVLPMVLLAGLWLAWNALLKKRATTAAESSLWVVFALAAALVFLAQPARLVGGLSGTTTGLSRAILGGVAGLDPKTGPADGITTSPSYGGDPADNELRAVADRMWRTYVYAPWTVLEFGSTDKGQQWGERLLAAKALTPDEAEAIKNDPEKAKAISEENKAEYEEIRNAIKKDPQAKAYFNGHRPGQRIAVAGLALAAVVLSGGLIAALALATLFAQLAMILLVMLAPVFLLAAIHPGAGRVIATRWVNLIVYTAVKRVAYAVLLSVIVVMNGALIDQGSKLGWTVAMMLSIALSGALLFYRKAFLSIVERIGSGGLAAAPGITATGDAGGRLARKAAVGGTIVATAAGFGSTVLAGRAGARTFRRLATDPTTTRQPPGSPTTNSAGAAGLTPPAPAVPAARAGQRPEVAPKDNRPGRAGATPAAGTVHDPSTTSGEELTEAEIAARAFARPAKPRPSAPANGRRRGRFPTTAAGVAFAARRAADPKTLNPHRDAVTDHFSTPPPDPDDHR